MGRGDLSDAEWERLRPFLPVSNGRCGRWRDHRQVIDGILHRVRTGVQWRDLPERFGPWKTVYERHRLWSADGTWERLLQQVQAVADAAGEIDWDISVDSTTWNRRYREYMEKIKTGSVFEIAQVLRDLYLLKSDKDLSFGERKMLDTARSLLIKELSLAKDCDEQTIEDDLKKIFNTSP